MQERWFLHVAQAPNLHNHRLQWFSVKRHANAGVQAHVFHTLHEECDNLGADKTKCFCHDSASAKLLLSEA